jgi:ABC-2 type transport system permease protein
VISVAGYAIRRQLTALLWWTVGLAGLTALLVAAYPTVRDNAELDRTFAGLPPGVEQLLGLGSGDLLTSPSGYLDSQFFTNLFPMALMIYAIGYAAWTIAGDEQAGSLELLLANPIGVARVALARLAALLVTLAWLAAVPAVVVAAGGPATGVSAGLPLIRLFGAAAVTALTALVFAAVAFAVGAATGSRSMAIGVAAGLAVVGYLVEGLAPAVRALHAFRVVDPWHWLIGADSLRNGPSATAILAPLAVTIVLAASCLPVLSRRDLG